MTLNGQTAYIITSNRNIICQGRNVRLVLVQLTYLFCDDLMMLVWPQKGHPSCENTTAAISADFPGDFSGINRVNLENGR